MAHNYYHQNNGDDHHNYGEWDEEPSGDWDYEDPDYWGSVDDWWYEYEEEDLGYYDSAYSDENWAHMSDFHHDQSYDTSHMGGHMDQSQENYSHHQFEHEGVADDGHHVHHDHESHSWKRSSMHTKNVSLYDLHTQVSRHGPGLHGTPPIAASNGVETPSRMRDLNRNHHLTLTPYPDLSMVDQFKSRSAVAWSSSPPDAFHRLFWEKSAPLTARAGSPPSLGRLNSRGTSRSKSIIKRLMAPLSARSSSPKLDRSLKEAIDREVRKVVDKDVRQAIDIGFLAPKETEKSLERRL